MASLPYSTRTCITGCTSFDLHFQTCQSTSPSNLTQCACTFNGDPTPYTGALNACTVCDAAGLGANNLTTYQKWAVVCNTYVDDGDAAAESLANDPQVDVLVAIFSSTLLPQLTSQALQTPTPTIGTVLLTGSVPQSTPTALSGSSSGIAMPSTAMTMGSSVAGSSVAQSTASSARPATSSASAAGTSITGTSASPATTSGGAGAVVKVPKYLGMLGLCAVVIRGL